MRRIVGTLAVALALSAVPSAEAALLQTISAVSPVSVTSLPLSPAATLCPPAATQPPNGTSHACSIPVAGGVSVECSQTRAFAGDTATNLDVCGVQARDPLVGCVQTSSTDGRNGTQTFTCGLIGGTTVAVSCTESFAGGVEASSNTLTCTAWPVTYSEHTASEAAPTRPVNRTTLKIGDVTIVCLDFPGAQMSCTRTP